MTLSLSRSTLSWCVAASLTKLALLNSYLLVIHYYITTIMWNASVLPTMLRFSLHIEPIYQQGPSLQLCRSPSGGSSGEEKHSECSLRMFPAITVFFAL